MTDLINTLETPGEFDALSSLRPGEPYFLLVGRDRLAPPLIQQWADENRRRAMANEGPAEGLERELRKSTEAEIISWSMQAYKRGEPADPVIEAQSAKEAYSGVVLGAAQVAINEEQRARTKAASVINNAVAELYGINEALAPFGVEPVSKTLLDILEAAAVSIVPARPV